MMAGGIFLILLVLLVVLPVAGLAVFGLVRSAGKGRHQGGDNG